MLRKIISLLSACTIMLGILPAAAADSSSLLPQSDDYNVTVGSVRVQTLSDTLARIEVKGPKGFEDRLTYHIVNRDFDFVTPEITSENGVVSIATENYTVHIPENAQTLDGIKITNPSGRTIWQYTSLPSSNQFLPDPGDTPNAWAMADNPRIVPAAWGYEKMPEGTTENTDINGWDDDNQAPDMYIFMPKKDYKTLLKDFITLTGSSEMIPLKAFGLWHSRYYNYKQQEALDLIDEYRENGLPLDNFVVDTDWRVSASTGYDINTASWPDMEGFLEDAHTEKHVNIMFNDHPEPQNGQHALSQADLNYRNENLTRLFDIGLDTWWFDRNWSTTIISPFSGISKESFGMYLYHDITKRYNPDKRPMIMGNVDGIDNGAFNRAPNVASHRYSMQWTGDTWCKPSDLKQEIVDIVRSGVVSSNPYINSDAGGHNGALSDGMHMRWTQYAALSPIFRYHCTDDKYTDVPGKTLNRQPWLYGAEALENAQDYTAMRYRLLPLYYNLSHENYLTGLPMLRRLDVNYPQYAEAQDDTQYLLGDNILIAPIWDEGTVTRDIFIPDGRWIDIWSGDEYTGPQTVSLSYDVDKSPIFVRSGTITPLAENVEYIGEKDWSNIALDIYPSTRLDGKNTLYEDDQVSVGYKSGEFRTTDLLTTYDSETGETVIKIGAAEGTFDGADSIKNRNWKLRIHMPESWGEIESAVLDGSDVIKQINIIDKSASAKAFSIDGAAADSDIAEITFTRPLTQASELRIKFASPVDEQLPEYPESDIDAEISDTVVSDDVDISSESAYDWARYDAQDGSISVISKQDSEQLIGDIITQTQVSSEDTMLKYSAGQSGETVSSSSALALNSGELTFTVKTAPQDRQIKVYIAAKNAAGRLTVTDNSKFTKIADISSLNGTTNKLVTVTANSPSGGELSFKLAKTDGTGAVMLCAIAVSDSEYSQTAPVEFTADLQSSPSSLNLSSQENIDWVHMGLGGKSDVINRKADTLQILPDPVTEGTVLEVTDYRTGISFDGGYPTDSASNSHNGISIQGSVELKIPSTEKWRELKLYFGVWETTNNISIYDESGNKATNLSFSAGGTADTRCLTVRFRSDTPSNIYVHYERGSNSGNVSLAAYSLSEIGKTQSGITAQMTDVPDAVDLSDGSYDFKHFGYSSASSVTSKASLVTSVIEKTRPLASTGRLEKSDDFKTAFSWSGGTPVASSSGTRNFSFSTEGEILKLTALPGEYSADVYLSAWRSKAFVQVTDESGALIDGFVLESLDDGSAYGMLSINAELETAQTLSVTITPALAYDGFRGNVSIAAAAVYSDQTPPLDLRELSAAIAQAESIDLTGFTSASVNALTAALNAAKAISKKSDALQSEIDSAVNTLNAAVRGLVKDVVKPPVPTPPKTVPVASVSVSQKRLKLTAGKSKKLKASYSPANASGAKITWSTNSKKTATVSNSGKITAKAPGTAVITAMAGGKSAKITVTVNPKKVSRFKVSKKGRKITCSIKKADKSYKTLIQYRKKGAKKYKTLKLTNAKTFKKLLKKGRYQIKACSYIKVKGKIYKSAFTKAVTVKIK